MKDMKDLKEWIGLGFMAFMLFMVEGRHRFPIHLHRFAPFVCHGWFEFINRSKGSL